MLDGNALPWVSKVKHLGHVLESDNSMKTDIIQKRGVFIGQVNSLLQEFHNVPPHVMINLLHIYATAVYGSNVWDIQSPGCEKLYNSYNVAIRNILNIDRTSHRYMIEPLSDKAHLKTLLASRYTTFYRSLVDSKKFPVRYLARISEDDNRTVIGKTLSFLKTTCNVSDLSLLRPSLVKQYMVYKHVPDCDQWRVYLAKELLEARIGGIPGFSNDEINDLLNFACRS